ncbi:hypothetical protein DM02DRAFT_610374 [Periconia macrospinosa]|uniref:Uncharacterized protein n=1 Tax=Periconia macrospinosa TaxID=97972 RepID=A0A2V1E503_9PLEO|nr:hypothetical protein DM02DRAFT_610374 [Periconia macrospinosa]
MGRGKEARGSRWLDFRLNWLVYVDLSPRLLPTYSLLGTTFGSSLLSIYILSA